MKASFLGAATYAGPAPGFGVWPAPPEACDRETASRSMRRTIENCRRAADLGFDWISVSEHHYAPYMLTPNPLVLAGALCEAVKTTRIALLGPLLPLANPVRVAEEIAMLDSISDGRVVVLFLRGTPSEHHVYADVAAPSRAMTQEGIDLILKAWTTPQPFAWDGEHFHYKTVSVWPRTRQDPHPPVFGSGNSEDSARFAASRKIGLAMSFMPAPTVKHMVGLYKSEAKKAGWTPTKDHILYRGICAISDTNERHDSNFDKAAAALKPGDKPPEFVMGAYFTGGPRNVLRQIEELRACGVGVIDMNLSSSIDTVNFDSQISAIELFANKVLPEIRNW